MMSSLLISLNKFNHTVSLKLVVCLSRGSLLVAGYFDTLLNQTRNNVVAPSPIQRKRITIAVVKSLKPNTKIWDTELKGFGVRRQAGPAVSYICKTAVAGKPRWFTIGRHGPWTPDKARKQALKILADPEAAAKPSRTKSVPTVASLADHFFTTHGTTLKPRTLQEYQRLFKLYLRPAFGSTLVTDITRAQVSEKHASWKHHPRAANHAIAVFSKMLNWAEDEGYRKIGSNPLLRFKRYKETSRERFLSTIELKRLGAALNHAEQHDLASIYAIAAIRLLIFTGARLSEILTLRWSNIDIERRMIFLDDSKTGKKPLTLNRPALTILTELPRVHANPYVIVGLREGAHLVNLQKVWRRIREIAELDDVRIHDLRHTFASTSVANGGSLKVLGRQLGHQRSQTTDRYSHLNDAPVQELTETTGEALAEAMGFAA